MVEELQGEFLQAGKKYKCDICSKAFNRKIQYEYHKQTCKVNIQETVAPCTKRAKTEDYAVQIGGADIYQSHPEFWEIPKKVESALSDTAVTYRKEFDERLY